MASFSYSNSNAPATTTAVNITTYRKGASVIIRADVTVTIVSGGFYKYNSPMVFSMFVNDRGAVAGTSYTFIPPKWYEYSARSRTFSTEMVCNTNLSGVTIGCNIYCEQVSSEPTHYSFIMPVQWIWQTLPAYVAPTAPTYCSVSPNPCDINSSALVTWGGASAGSISSIAYNLQIRVKKSDGTWSGWTNLQTNTTAQSFNTGKLASAVVSGVGAYVGIQWQYRVQTTDRTYTTSGWRESPILTASFQFPTAPTTFTVTPTTTKADKPITIRWNGATGGAGTLTYIRIDMRVYNHLTKTWGDWKYYIRSSNATSSYYTGTPEHITPGADLKNGDKLQFRPTVTNSFGQQTVGTNQPIITIRGNQVWVKLNGNWVEGDLFIKQNGNWIEGTPYLKQNGIWKESI